MTSYHRIILISKRNRVNIELFSALFICQNAFRLNTSNIYILIQKIPINLKNSYQKKTPQHEKSFIPTGSLPDFH